jgi:hypothetical protein
MNICSSCGKLGEFYQSQPYICKPCVKVRARAWYLANKERALKNVSAYRRENRVAVRAGIYEWGAKNPDAVAAIKRRYVDRHPDRRTQSRKKWYVKNKDRHAYYMSCRKSLKIKSTPLWANTFFMQEAYALAKLRTRVLGERWHVDHIVPLQSKLVCGLHCEQNLRVIPAVLNLSKHNKTWPDMP